MPEHTSDHVLDEITMSGGIDDGDVVLGRLKLPQGDVDGDTALSLSLYNAFVNKEDRISITKVPTFSLSSTHAYLNDPFPIS